MSIFAWILTILLGLPIAGLMYQAVATQRDKRRFPPRGQFVDIGGHRLHLNVTGVRRDLPTVILEAGMGSFSSNWVWVQQALSSVTRVVSYDRAGLGWSDPGQQPLDAAKSAHELHTALQRAGIESPYVLAGHSYGGMVVRMFADLYPDEVVGIVLVDASHPDQWIHIPASKEGSRAAFANRVTAFLARFGVMRLFRLEESFITGLPERAHAEMRAFLARPDQWITAANGILAWRDLSRQQMNNTRTLGSKPLFVLSVTEQSMFADALTKLQAELPSLSTNSKHVTVEGATHYTLVSKHEYAMVVSAAIQQVLDAAGTSQPLQ